MKKLFSLIVILSVISVTAHSQILKKLSDKVKDKTNQKVDQKTDNAIDNTLDKADDATKTNNSNTTDKNSSTSTSSGSSQSAAPSMKSYQNYDFVPGDTVVFEDHFIDDQDGEFPAHWELQKGQAVVNKLNGTPSFYL